MDIHPGISIIIMDINNTVTYFNDWIMDIRDWIMTIHNDNHEIHNCIMDINDLKVFIRCWSYDVP